MAWRSKTKPGHGLARAALVIAVACVAVWIACPAHAASARDPRFQPNLEATVKYLQETQREDGGFAEPGHEPEPDFTAWVALALAAAGINPRDQTTAKQHYQLGHSAYTYLAEHAHEASATTDFERELLVVDATGTSPYDFGGVDLVQEILKRQLKTGSSAGAFPYTAGSPTGEVNDTVFAILALSPIHEQAVEGAIREAAQWLEAQQNCDGSWNSVNPRTVRPCDPKERRLLPGEGAGEVDMTGAAIQALNAAKRSDPGGQTWAFEYLHEAESPDGGFPELPFTEKEPNVASTAWVVQALWSAGLNPETWATHSGLASEEPLGYLASMQQENGHIRWEQSQEQNGMLMTAYVTPALTGNQLPIPEAPPEPLPSLPPEEPTGGGGGGVATNPGGGVISGGGGDGAPLFSRPQPSSKGHTPGGVRQLADTRRRADAAKRRDPVARRTTTSPRQPTPAPTLHASRHVRSEGTAKKGAGATGKGSGPGGSGVGELGQVAATAAGGTSDSGSDTVKGVLLSEPLTAFHAALEGAPGLHGARSGANQSPWPALAVAIGAVLLALLGAHRERKRPRTVL
jgi:hypothetical protein